MDPVQAWSARTDAITGRDRIWPLASRPVPREGPAPTSRLRPETNNACYALWANARDRNGGAAAELNRLRRAWLNPEGASGAELTKRTLTNLYNARPTWLQLAHAALDRAVWAAYGWDDPDPATVDEDTILAGCSC